MEDENEKYFIQEFDKLMNSDVAMTKWALNMDLLAIVTFDHMIQLFRISYKFQRVFQIQETKPIRSLAFTLDSHFIAYGLLDGTVRIVRIQNGEKIMSVDGLHQSEVESLSFIHYCKLNPKLFMPFQKDSLESKLILSVSPHKNCNKNAIVKINYFNQLNNEFSLLLSSQKRRTCILLNGFMEIAQINYSETKINSLKVLLSHYDGKLISVVAEQKMDEFILHNIQYQATQLKKYEEQIVKLNCLIGLISEILNFVEGTYTAMETQVKDILRQYNSKIDLIDDLTNRDANQQPINPRDELFRFLNLGITSSSLVNFFSKQLYDSKIPQKLDETLTSLFASLHDLIIESTQNSLERVTLLLQKLRNMIEAQSFKIFNIKVIDLETIMEKVTKLYTMTEILLVESTEAKFDIRNLLVWLNKSTIKTSQQNDVQIENTKSYLNKYTVDFNRLHQFLENPKKFRLQNLAVFFSKNNQVRQLNIETPQFRLLGQQQSPSNPQLLNNFTKLSKLLQIEDIILPQNNQKNKIIFNSFAVEMSHCVKLWRTTAQKPIKNISQLISKKFQMFEIGRIKFNQLYEFELKQIIKNNHLFVYFIERSPNNDRIVQYNCNLKTKSFVFSSKFNILSLAVAENIIAVLEQKITKHKTIAQITNEVFNGNEIQIGRLIDKLEGQLDINSSLKGLNSVIVDKNKLIIFD